MIITKHATKRMAQRGIQLRDAELIELIGTPVHNGYFVRVKDCQAAEREIKQLLTCIKKTSRKTTGEH